MSRDLSSIFSLALVHPEPAPGLLALAREDMACVFERDPAARSRLEVLMTYPGLHAMFIHRPAHRPWQSGWRFAARWLGWLARFMTNVDIHPGATIGRRFFIDHGAGVVIGIPARLVGESGARVGAGATAGAVINLDHHLIPDPVGKAIQCLLDRLDTLELEVRGLPAPVKAAGCIACAAGELCCEEHGRG